MMSTTQHSQSQLQTESYAAPWGVPVARGARFSSPHAEAEALDRGRRAFDRDFRAGRVPSHVDPKSGARSYVDPLTGQPVRYAVVVTTNRPGGFGVSHVVRRQPPPSYALKLDAEGQRVAIPSLTPLVRARLIHEYHPASGTFRLLTYHPEAVARPDEPNLR